MGGNNLARCLPINEVINNRAEEIVKDFINKNFDETYFLYHNYEIKGNEFDFLFIDPATCVYIIEVKGWRESEIIKVKSSNSIIYRDSNGFSKEFNSSPLEQVRKYKFNLINLIKEKFNYNIKVVHLVCYPRINKEDFYRTELNKISDECITILKDDLSNKKNFLKKIYEVEKLYQNKTEGITSNQILSIRTLFETKEELRWNKNKVSISKIDNIDIEINCDTCYSILLYLRSGSKIEDDLYLRVIELWKSGCKIHLISDDETLAQFRQVLISKIGYLKKYNDFNVNNNTISIFNLWMYTYYEDDIEKNFIVIDGKYEKYKEELIKINETTNFNFSQYELEHSDINKDIYVTAGAGSGKTYSMISRITYLIYKHKYLPEELYKKIILITFTNEAANNMKEKLKHYFMNYYLLTANKIAFKYIEEVNKMQISTIHSLAKKLIEVFGTELGLGINTKISNGIMDVRKIIDKHVDEYINEKYPGQDILSVFNFRTYKFTEIINELLKKIEAKNIYLGETYDFGEPHYEAEKFIKERLPLIQKELITTSLEENNVRLGEMIIILKQLIKKTNVFVGKKFELDYLFVDEFQDTDDIQIELIQAFQNISGFNFFVVGDIKQCIYRFRGAKDDAFDRLIKDRTDCVNYKLYKNYRTDKELLDKFHLIFEQWAVPKYLEYGDGDRLQGVKSISKDKSKLLKIETKSEVSEDDLITALRSEKQRLVDESCKDNKKKKIAILVRTNTDVDIVKQWCENNDISIEANTKGNIYTLESTKDLYILVLALSNNRDPKCLFNLFETSYTTKKEDRSRMFNMRGNVENLLEYFEELNPIEKWDEYINKIKMEPIMKVIREIIFNIEPWVIYSSRFKEEERTKRQIFYKRNLEQLLENIINEYSRDYITLNKLIESLAIKIFTGATSDVREDIIEDENTRVSIVCTTIHKSKGLEYDTVILPFCDKPLNQKLPNGLVEVMIEKNIISYSIQGDNPYEDKNSNPFMNRIANEYFGEEFDEEKNHKLNEEIRILYVALTRAISKVIYFKNVGKRFKDNEKLAQDIIDIR